MARDSGGALQGYSSAGSYFVSKLNNPVDFDFAATRLAGEGDIIIPEYLFLSVIAPAIRKFMNFPG